MRWTWVSRWGSLRTMLRYRQGGGGQTGGGGGGGGATGVKLRKKLLGGVLTKPTGHTRNRGGEVGARPKAERGDCARGGPGKGRKSAAFWR